MRYKHIGRHQLFAFRSSSVLPLAHLFTTDHMLGAAHKQIKMVVCLVKIRFFLHSFRLLGILKWKRILRSLVINSFI